MEEKSLDWAAFGDSRWGKLPCHEDTQTLTCDNKTLIVIQHLSEEP